MHHVLEPGIGTTKDWAISTSHAMPGHISLIPFPLLLLWLAHLYSLGQTFDSALPVALELLELTLDLFQQQWRHERGQQVGVLLALNESFVFGRADAQPRTRRYAVRR